MTNKQTFAGERCKFFNRQGILADIIEIHPLTVIESWLL
jgi:hypothetical protein